MLKAETKLMDFIQRHIYIFGALAVLVLSVWIRVSMMKAVSGDLENAILPWYDNLRSQGLFAFLRTGEYDYNIPYMTILWLLTKLPVGRLAAVKCFGIMFDYAQAMLMGLCVLRFCTGKHIRLRALAAFAAGCLSPLVFLDSAYWGQCDSVFSCFILLSLCAALCEKYPLGLLFMGIAGSFKLQAWFVLPVFVLLYCVTRKFSALWFLLLPGTLFVAGIPAYLAGMPLTTVFDIYFKQLGLFRQLNMNFPNWYVFFNKPYELLSSAGYVLALTALGAMAVWLLATRMKLRPDTILLLGAWSNYVCTLFLPDMHERYGYPALILLCVYVLLRPNKRMLTVTLMLSGTSLATYAWYFYGTPQNANYLLTVVNYAAWIMMTQILVRTVRADNGCLWEGETQETPLQGWPESETQTAERLENQTLAQVALSASEE